MVYTSKIALWTIHGVYMYVEIYVFMVKIHGVFRGYKYMYSLIYQVFKNIEMYDIPVEVCKVI